MEPPAFHVATDFSLNRHQRCGFEAAHGNAPKFVGEDCMNPAETKPRNASIGLWIGRFQRICNSLRRQQVTNSFF
jgi:endonuclease YncB( thermonuclease family)